ncbi:hypothetical protein SSS_03663 [Sarcoptes scabiei]|uniref:Uncharacterized protein n=1 Tax=Sarcoptes scabiei TaxID=52283 RepID=A0A834R9U1_SARSC|nr:hypothetical protein SSS_03663 [Sarcoptes scabiei]UXI19012.1 G1/S-specific cyclin-E1 [Sarcoptes scabiei]
MPSIISRALISIDLITDCCIEYYDWHEYRTILYKLLSSINDLQSTNEDFIEQNHLNRLYFYLIKDVIILIAILILFLQFFHEDFLREGRIRSLFLKHWHLIAICFFYLVFVISLQLIGTNYYDQFEWRNHSTNILQQGQQHFSKRDLIRSITNEPLHYFVFNLLKRTLSIMYYFCLEYNFTIN